MRGRGSSLTGDDDARNVPDRIKRRFENLRNVFVK